MLSEAALGSWGKPRARKGKPALRRGVYFQGVQWDRPAAPWLAGPRVGATPWRHLVSVATAPVTVAGAALVGGDQ